jgi:GNAT superfamily N-acetyltransferase
VNTLVAPAVVPAARVELPRLAQVLSTAFADNPVSDWLFQGEQDSHHPAFFAAYLRHALAAGRIEQTTDGTAVAVWVDHTSRPALEVFHRESAEAVGVHLPRLTQLEAALYDAQPRQPHWWLAFLGVLPTHRGRGHGSRLLGHARRWQGDTLSYLEATSLRLVGWYAQHGYCAGPALPVPHGPTVHPMWHTG